LKVLDSAETVFYSWIGKEIPVNPTRTSGRIIIFSTCITGALLIWSYNAGLVSYLTVETIIFPITNLQVKEEIYKIYFHYQIKWYQSENPK
jgi:hypothetical protein